MKFEFDVDGFEENLKEQLREQCQTKLNAAGLSHATFRFLGDGAKYEIEGLLNQDEKDKAIQAIFGPQ